MLDDQMSPAEQEAAEAAAREVRVADLLARAQNSLLAHQLAWRLHEPPSVLALHADSLYDYLNAQPIEDLAQALVLTMCDGPALAKAIDRASALTELDGPAMDAALAELSSSDAVTS